LDERDDLMLVWGRKTVLQSERGVALLLTLMLMVVFSLLSVSLFEMLKASTQISGNHRFDLKATYIADAGVEDAINRLRINPDLGNSTFTGTLAGSTYSVTITDGSPSNAAIYDEKDIESTGTVNDFSRTINTHVWIVQVFGTNPPIYIVMTTYWKLP
jgi:Tfp pilus assembly protein PilX